MKIRLVVAVGAFLAALSVPTAAVASAPAVTVTPLSLTFGAQNPEGPYSSQAFTVANSGDAPLVISSVTVENSAPGGGNDYTQTNNCYPFPRALAPGESCAITIGFFPNAYGVRTGAVVITDSAAGSPHRVPLTGYSYPFKAMYTLDGYGGLHPDNPISPVMTGTAYWPGWKIARAAVLLSDASGGYTLDGFGGLHQFGSAPQAVGAAYFGWDIARDVVLLPGSTATHAAGYVLDGWGALHPFGGALPIAGGPYWKAWDIATKVNLLPDGSGGYVMDGWGGLHPFAVGTSAPPRGITDGAYWPHWSIARDFTLFSNSTPTTPAGVTLDGYGGVHPFGFSAAPGQLASGYWPGWNIARSVRVNPTSTPANPGGWEMEGFGGVHSFGGAQAVPGGAYWNWDIAVELVVVR